ncbi:RagB/SusD family nutrient uptake outer membrane protein [Prolixibacteraceae bacterium JC049]|nr:RagB/SusD family nutrient uptake outer membrane protein [Prolixibacteraceae bacterium JC049]
MRNTIILLVLFIGFYSCDDYLDRDPLDKIAETSIFQDESLCQAYLYNVYSKLNHPLGYYYMTDNCTDNGRTKSGWISSQKVVVPGLMSATNIPGEMGSWKNSYKAIRLANDFIEKLEASKLDADFKQLKLAEARWLRAEFYFELVKRFGDVPLIKVAQKSGDDLAVSRTPAADVWKFIDEELDAIDEILPLKADSKNGLATREACWALGSRAMLYAKNWSKCIDYSKRIISGGAFQLNADYGALFASYGGDKEVIFEILFDGPANKGHHFDLYNLPFSYRADWGSQTNPTQELVDAYCMANGKAINEAGSGYDANNPYVGREPRFYATILYHGAKFKGKVMNTISPDGEDAINKTGLHSITGYYIKKYCDEKLPFGPLKNDSKISWKMFRLAEIYLNLAEAENEANGPNETVLNSLKAIRDRVNLPNVSASLSKDEMRTAIRKERRVELAFEDQRWWDLIRWGKSIEVLNDKYFHGVMVTRNDDGTLNYNLNHVVSNRPKQVFLEKHYLMPIPHGEREKNPNLTQNSGY